MSNSEKSYPHVFLNREELELSAPEPWFEYPVFKYSIFEDDDDPGYVRMVFSVIHAGYDVVYHDPTKRHICVKEDNGHYRRLDFTKAVLCHSG